MKMNKIGFILMIGILSSCQQVFFKTPQPKNGTDLNYIPQDIQGKYICSKDTIIIKEKSFLVITDSIREYFLSDSIKLRVSNNLYFLNKKEGNYWSLLVCKTFAHDSIQLSAILGISTDNDLAYKQLKKISRVQKSNDYFILNPNKQQLNNLINSEYFQTVMLIKRLELN
jgi:hypothetical protein